MALLPQNRNLLREVRPTPTKKRKPKLRTSIQICSVKRRRTNTPRLKTQQQQKASSQRQYLQTKKVNDLLLLAYWG